MSFTQTKRPIRITTPLGTDELLLKRLHGTEELGQLFHYHAEVLSERGDIALEELLGQRVDIELDLGDGARRHFNAFVSSFQQFGETGRLVRYRLELHPWLWFLQRNRDCRIYQNLTTPEILKALFEERGFGDYALRLGDDYPIREYCVQYRESDFNFVSRLMEEEGIYYYFSHAAGRHTLVLCDNYGSHKALSGGAELPFHPPTGRGGVRSLASVTEWRMSKRVCSGRYAHTDYDFEKPRDFLEADAPLRRDHAHAGYEVFDYPGLYLEREAGERYARSRIEELQAGHEQLEGRSDARHMAVGGLFKLSGHPRAEQNREYLITKTEFKLSADSYGTGARGGGEREGSWCFSCIDSRESYRRPRQTNRPLVTGPQTAVVVGPAGQEIHTDPYGRVKVQFRWDRYGNADENSSCWVRVAQVWAGHHWGAIHIPRIGQEVIVEFLEGDPDRPIITGSVYNAKQMPPWGLPANQTQSGILSHSTKEGYVTQANALRFEDKKGEEQLWLHAEKDQLTEVEHDEDKWVGNDRRKTIDGNETTTVHKNRTETVDQDETITVHQNRGERVDGNETISIGANRTEDVGGNETIGIAGNRVVSISGNKMETVTQGKAENIALGKALSVGGAYQVTVIGAMNTSVGLVQAEEVGRSKHVLVKKQFTIRAGDEFKVEVGKSTLILKSDGSILIEGKTIDLIASSAVKINGKDVDIN
jgi:type VI secretion system secreted protein VgrG